MYCKNVVCTHEIYDEILKAREITNLKKGMPLWKLKLMDWEYEKLKQTLYNHKWNLSEYGIEAALCYAEWWRRDYNGGVPSKEDVAEGIGVGKRFADDLFKSAQVALKKYGYKFIHSQKGTEYFRTLLNQGGLPVVA